MKKRPSLIILVSTLTLLNGGCGSPGGNQAPPSPSPSVSPPPPPPPSPSPQAAAPLPSASPNSAVTLGLIPSTKPSQRRQEILSGRTNPFALIPLQATIRESVCKVPLLKPQAAQAATVPTSTGQPVSNRNAAKTVKSSAQSSRPPAKTGNNPTVATRPSQTVVNPSLNPKSSFNPFNPLLNQITSLLPSILNPSSPSATVPPNTSNSPTNPKTTVAKTGKNPNSAIIAKAPFRPAVSAPIPVDAQGVEVSGVLKIGNKPFAIVKAPGEPVARYVTTGASLSNGRVRVTAIDTSLDNPGITVEQYGVTVSRAVGQAPEGIPNPTGSPSNGQTNSQTNSQNAVFSVYPSQVINPQVRAGSAPLATLTGPQTQVIAQLPTEGEGDRVAPTFQAVPKGPTSVALIPPDKSGFGEVRGLSLLTLKIQVGSYGMTRSSGIICNAGKDPIKVKELTLQLEDKTNNTILDSLFISFYNAYSLKYGQKLEFDGSLPNLRGRNLKDITVKLIDWSSGGKSSS
ncbi:MAG: hypothetical protein VKL42_04145 [Snowella sp.]|nr:hypothetical protein [Snowella sp.]